MPQHMGRDIIQPSLDLLSFNDMATPMLEHVNGTNSIGDVVFAGTASVACATISGVASGFPNSASACCAVSMHFSAIRNGAA